MIAADMHLDAVIFVAVIGKDAVLNRCRHIVVDMRYAFTRVEFPSMHKAFLHADAYVRVIYHPEAGQLLG